jgi:K+-sensing histidine kinase KdpD
MCIIGFVIVVDTVFGMVTLEVLMISFSVSFSSSPFVVVDNVEVLLLLLLALLVVGVATTTTMEGCVLSSSLSFFSFDCVFVVARSFWEEEDDFFVVS